MLYTTTLLYQHKFEEPKTRESWLKSLGGGVSVSAGTILVLEGVATYPQEVMTEDLPETEVATEAVAELNSSDLSTSPSSALSVSNESHLLVPTNLHNDLSALKNCYITILKELDPEKERNSEGTDIVMLTRDQMSAGMRKNKVLDKATKQHLIDLMDNVRPLCVAQYSPDTRPKRVPQEVALDNLSDQVSKLVSKHHDDLQTITSELTSLKSSLKDYENSSSRPIPASPTLIDLPSDTVLSNEHKQNHLVSSCCVDDYLTAEKSAEIFDNLKNLRPYKSSRGRSTLQFGEQYRYNGSEGDAVVEPPDYIRKLMKDLNSRFGVEGVPAINSCLVTKYSGPNAYIPVHSDRELAIHPESNIITVSLGKESTVRFYDILSGKEEQHTAKIGSVYTMSRKSQDCFKHGIDRNAEWSDADTRISLTFRSVHWRNRQSTIIVGDSNTCGLKFASFGSDSSAARMSGTFGNAMPGKQTTAFITDEIDPTLCLGYNNIVVHVGINDIKNDECASEGDVRDKYIAFKAKMTSLTHMNRSSRLYVSSLLPTKSPELNKKVKLFNGLLFSDFAKSFRNVKLIDNFSRFSDNLGKLSPSISREFNSRNELDMLHLNETGLRMFSSSIKSTIFYRKRTGGENGPRRDMSGATSYADVARPPSGYRGRGRGRGGANRYRNNRRP